MSGECSKLLTCGLEIHVGSIHNLLHEVVLLDAPITINTSVIQNLLQLLYLPNGVRACVRACVCAQLDFPLCLHMHAAAGAGGHSGGGSGVTRNLVTSSAVAAASTLTANLT